ncbi:hypothetical protein DUT91_05015 [Phyllobacterium salinisoli]|uniref:DUF4287 domain-containing protein n=1 Tax=Phyllobacterium salinisoli TaxID=1899321 RepID=A0A368K8T2_9HYPH|nr:hypothetical protein [Phyllobacterium salinisoli]RCS24822.1 hypothetical protein DUT91_05015 [Phyllobacterium salinisoli]
MARRSNIAAIEKATGRSFEDWLAYFRSIDAETLSHKEIAERIVQAGLASGWWAQAVTVAYEQHIGRRIPGQKSDGTFQLSLTKTVGGTMDEVLEQWSRLMEGRSEIGGIPVSHGPETSRTEKWRYWRCRLGDGTHVNVHIYQKTPDKAGLGIGHENLPSEAQIEHWRSIWKEMLTTL